MDADAGIFVEDALQAGLADAAEAGDFGDGGLAVDTAVQKNAALVTEATSASESLLSEANELVKSIEYFKLKY